jgi:precorrin-2 dehydrogenase / sirohydrochlorin ferrochelatase
MIALAIDPAVVSVAVAGRGLAALRRFEALRTGGAAKALLFSDQPVGVASVSRALIPRLPAVADLAGLRALWIAGLPDERASELASLARSVRVLVNVEDRPGLCDFHSVAEVRRGDLLLTVSTNGSSPRLAARIRARLETEYPADWRYRVAILRLWRKIWRQQGRNVTALTDALLEANGWLT